MRAVTAARSGIVVDVGANIGDGVALLPGNGVNAPIFAVEGAQEYADLLKKNGAKLQGAEIAICLLSDKSIGGFVMEVTVGTAKLIKGDSDNKRILLDELCNTFQLKEIAVLETDTDGYDVKVIQGSKRILRDIGPLIFSGIDENLL